MNNLFVYCEIEEGIVADVSLELLTKGRSLANQLNCQLEAVVAGSDLKDIEKQVLPYGVDKLHVFDAEGLYPYTSLPHTSILVNLFKEEKPQICLMGATVIGRDLGPRVSSALTSGLTADCTALEIGDHEEKKEGKVYKNLLYQIRPAFGGMNIGQGGSSGWIAILISHSSATGIISFRKYSIHQRRTHSLRNYSQNFGTQYSYCLSYRDHHRSPAIYYD